MWPGALALFVRGRWVPRKGWKQLTSKHSTKIYKGKGTMKTGLHDRWGRFVQVQSMMPKYVVPSLAGFPLKPYVVKLYDRAAIASSSSSSSAATTTAATNSPAAASSTSSSTTQ